MIRLPTPGERGLTLARIAAGALVAIVAASWVHHFFAELARSMGALP